MYICAACSFPGDAEAADPYTAWLTQYQMECYKDLLIKSGFDDLKFLVGTEIHTGIIAIIGYAGILEESCILFRSNCVFA